MTKVFYTQLTDLPINLEGLQLSEYRRAKLAKQRIEAKKQQGIAADLLLYHAVKSILPNYSGQLDIVVNEFGKPFFKNIALDFSLSHSERHIVCVVSDSPVGIDVESKAKYRQDLSERFFCADEISALRNSDNKDYDFARIWTAKESALKCIGTGIHRTLSSVNTTDASKIVLIPEGKTLQSFHWFVNDAHCSVCIDSNKLIEQPLFIEMEL